VDFTDAWVKTMTWEGGSTLHEVEGDPGGATRWGISQRAHPDVDVPTLSMREAMDIARTLYWGPVHAEQLDPDLRWHVFDTAFNAGVKQAGILLQRSINLCRQAKGQTTFLKEDGIVGPATLTAVSLHDGAKLARVFRAYRVEHYLTLAEIRSPQFIHGWLRRAEGEHNG
jgi:lysozyme family protein